MNKHHLEDVKREYFALRIDNYARWSEGRGVFVRFNDDVGWEVIR